MTIRLVLADITTLEVDAIVNAANSALMPGGGVDGAIHRAAGTGLISELKSHHKTLTPGDAIITSGYRLPAKHVIHTVAPMWIEGLTSQAEILADCYRNSLRLAHENSLKSIAFPSLGTGAFGIPKEIAMPTALNALSLQLQYMDSEMEVTICCYSQEDLNLFEAAAKELGAEKSDDGLIELTNLLPKCPMCFHQLKRIIYGFPSRDTLENQDNIFIGGCTIMGDDPDLGCKNCKWRGFIADVNLVEGELIAVIVDGAKSRFKAGVIYQAGWASSGLSLRPGVAEFQRGFTLEWLEEQLKEANEPSIWFAERTKLMAGAFEKVLMGYPALNKEVMEFAGFRPLSALPRPCGW